MHTLLKIKIGPFLVISSVLAVWMFLVAQHVQAHKPDSPTCTGLPTAEDFFDGDNETANITPTEADLTPTLVTKQGTGSAAKGGNTRYRYAKITVPQLAAGELRVFDTRGDNNASDAVLCHGSSTRARYRTTHPSSHTSAENARTSALTAQMRAENAGSTDASNTITESSARSALRSAASALRSAATALRSAATAIQRANLDPGTAITTANDAHTPASGSGNTRTPASGHAAEADTRAGDSTNDLAALKGHLITAAGNLGTIVSALRTAANVLHDTEAESKVFQLRAEVRPGDQEYILVTTDDAPALAVQFHGAIAATAEQRTRFLNAGAAHTIPITITAPGLLTLETTGSTDTIGMLDNATDAEVAHAVSGGSGGNFKFAVPVTASSFPAAFDLVVEGQDSRTNGEYTVEMDFRVAMVATGVTAPTGITLAPASTPWGNNTGVSADDTDLQIKRRPEDGNTTDEDYFLFTPTASGFLTVNATDDTTSAKDSNTKGTLYGAMETGPMAEMRAGEIATDADSGPGNHFKFTVPVEAAGNYLVKVEGTDGIYQLAFAFAQVASTDTITPPDNLPPASLDCSDAATVNDANEICTSTGTEQERDRYLFNIAEPGTLYVHSTGTTDVVGILYGPDGTLIIEDDDGGDGMNFRIAVEVAPGLHLLEVKGQNRNEQGVYGLVSNFVAGPGGPTTPGTGTGTDEDVAALNARIAALQAEVDQLENDLDACRDPVETDARGTLDNPSDGGFRSGIGVISGWVCAAEEIEVRIFARGAQRATATLDVAYGTSRSDTVGQCNHRSPNTGFGMTYNFNHLPEGEYTIQAYADDDPIGGQRTFTVVHLVDSFPDSNRLLTGLRAAECRVDDFPVPGEDTDLLWEQSTQNFVIEDAG